MSNKNAYQKKKIIDSLDKKVKKNLKCKKIPYGMILNDSKENYYSEQYYTSNNIDVNCFF
jgi:hypothetical protein